MSAPALPLVELGAPVLGEAEKRALAEVVDSGWLAMGERVRRFEEAFAAAHGVRDAVAVGSGAAALQLALAALGVGAGDEVLVPSLSFVATASAVVHVGARPVFVDLPGPDLPHLDPVDARRRVTSRTRAVVVMHYGGYAVDLAPWRALADSCGLFLVEDAAHAAGLPVGGSDAAAFSFFSNKNLTTAEGGMVVLPDDERRARVRLLRSHGMTSSTLDRHRDRAVGYDVLACGHNFRLDELRAAVGMVQLERLPAGNARRRELTGHYRRLLARELPAVAVPFAADHPTAAHLMPVLLPPGTDRAAAMAAMRAGGVQTSVHYPPIHRFTAYGGRAGTLPHTEAFAAAQLTLPLHPQLTEADAERVVAALGVALRGRT